jgi:predicted PurR-regulated permease PerM
VVVLLGLAGVVVAVAGLRGAAGILGPVLLALMLTVAANPLSTWLRRRGAPAWVAAAALVATVYLVLFGLGGVVALSAARLVDLMPEYQSQFEALRTDLAHVLADLGVDSDQVRDVTGSVGPGGVADVLRAVLGGARCIACTIE